MIALGAGGAAMGIGCTSAPPDTPPAPAPRTGETVMPALAGNHQPIPLAFDPRTARGLSERMLRSHHEKNYAGAVKNLNAVEKQLAAISAETPGFIVGSLRERELTFRNSKLLHEHYFENLGGDGQPAGAIEGALSQAYGSAAAWEAQLRATALSLGGGSGWVVIALELGTGALRIVGSGGHSQVLALGAPLLVLDMYEHSYHLDYGADHARYLEAFTANVKWEEVDRRFARARAAAELLASAG